MPPGAFGWTRLRDFREMKRAKLFVRIVLTLTLVAALVFTAYQFVSMRNASADLTWYSAAASAANQFGPVFLLEAILYGILNEKKKQKEETK